MPEAERAVVAGVMAGGRGAVAASSPRPSEVLFAASSEAASTTTVGAVAAVVVAASGEDRASLPLGWAAASSASRVVELSANV
jgi:hypothetical protein